MNNSLLQVKNLVVEFPGRHGTLRALDGISFDIAPGEILGVVGESGAGKSLTGASIIGLLEPPGRIVSGEILLEGQRIDNLSSDQMRPIRGRKIGAIFQDPLTSLNPLYSVGRQLTETILAHLPMSAAQARRRAIDLLQDTGIPAAGQRCKAGSAKSADPEKSPRSCGRGWVAFDQTTSYQCAGLPAKFLRWRCARAAPASR